MSPEGERAAELLQHANFRKVADAIGVSRSQVAQWAQGKQITPYRLMQLEELLGHKEAAPPDWAERLLAGIMALEDKGGVTEEELMQARARALIYLHGGTQRRPPRAGGGGGGATDP